MMILIGFHEYCGLFSELNGDVMDLKGIRGGINHKTRGVRPRNHGFENRHVQLRV